MSGSKKKFYYTIAKVLPWVAAFFIAFNLLSGWKIGGFPLEQKQLLIMVHSGIGTTILILMLIRWWWRKSHKLYTPPRWYRRPSMLLQWIFYPLLMIQPVLGILLAAFIDYKVLAYGFINYSALATDNENLQNLFLQSHKLMAILLIALIIIHGMERSRKAFMDDTPQPRSVERG